MVLAQPEAFFFHQEDFEHFSFPVNLFLRQTLAGAGLNAHELPLSKHVI